MLIASRCSGWSWLWARTILATTATVALVTFLACSGGNGTAVTPASPSEISIYLTWNPHTDTSVLGYRVYVGQALDPIEAMTMLAETATTEISFDWRRDLGSTPVACFRLRAYNADGESPATDGVCVTVP